MSRDDCILIISARAIVINREWVRECYVNIVKKQQRNHYEAITKIISF